MNYPENDYRDFLEHSAKGTHWKKGHKYIAIKNGRYIYPDDTKKIQTKEIEINPITTKEITITPAKMIDTEDIPVYDYSKDVTPNWLKNIVRPQAKVIKAFSQKKPLPDTKLAKSIDMARQKSSKTASRISKTLSSPIRKYRTNKKIKNAREDLFRGVTGALDPQVKVKNLVSKGRLSSRNNTGSNFKQVYDKTTKTYRKEPANGRNNWVYDSKGNVMTRDSYLSLDSTKKRIKKLSKKK